MTTPSQNPFYSSSLMAQKNGAVPIHNSASRMALDNLLRRELKVSNPNDAAEIAQALLSRYKDTPKAAAISREAQGVPFLMPGSAPPPTLQGMVSSEVELQQATSDVERDLQELTTNSVLKDITPELQGWATAIRSAMMEGIAAAQFAIDSRQRDKAFGIRRTLGDYARISRLIGALTPTLNIQYRKLAQSLDEVAAVLLVKMGEAIANIGFNSGRYLLQVAYSDLQARRDAVIYALRNLTGTTQEAFDPTDWQRGLNAYRLFYDYLEKSAQGDLRSLLVENELARVMDSLLQRAGQGGTEGLRQLGATFRMDIERLRRLVIVGHKAVRPQSPPFTAFLDAVQLFVDSVQPSGGSRLIRIARPPILFYGLYGQSVLSRGNPAQNLLQLIIYRGILADQLDRLAQSGVGPSTLKGQIIVDKILYDVDRAVDLYAAGTKDSFDQPERRAVAYSYVIDAFLNPPGFSEGETDRFTALRTLSGLAQTVIELDGDEQQPLFNDIRETLKALRELLYQALNLSKEPNASLPPLGDPNLQQLIRQELYIQRTMEAGWETLVQTMASEYIPYRELFGENGVINQLVNAAMSKTGGEYEDPELQLPEPDSVSLGTLANRGIRIIGLPNNSSPEIR